MKVCWNLSSTCNKACNYCFRELFEKYRSLDENIDIIKNLKSAGLTRITFSGGEPYLYKDILELLSFSKSIGLENYIITNGSILNKDNIEKCLKNIDKITFSIDSPSSYVNYESGRGYDSYSHVKELLPIIHEIYPTLPIEINSVVTKESLDEVDYMFDAISTELYPYGIKRWKIIRFYPLRGYAKERQELFDLSDEEFEKIEKKYKGKNTILFEVSTRNIDTMDGDLVVSPCGSLKKSLNGVETTLIEDLKAATAFEIISSLEEYEVNNVKKLLLGGRKNV